MCQDLCSQIQRAGRCARDPNVHGLFLYMPELWALTQPCDLESQSYADNPDLPLPSDEDGLAQTFKAKSIPKNRRISQGSLAYIQTSGCRRLFKATYLGDETPNGLISPMSCIGEQISTFSYVALEYTTGCCDNDNSLPLSLFLPGSEFTGDESTPAVRSRLRRPKYRPLKDREALVKALVEWREKALDQHPHQAMVTRRWILPNNTITALSKVCAANVHGPKTISEVANCSEEWSSAYASGIYEVIARFDARKLCACLGRGVAKKVRSLAWQKQVRGRYEENVELAFAIAEEVLGDVAEFEMATKREKRELLARHRTTADNMDERKRRVDVRRSELRWMLEDAVQNLREQCEHLQSVIVWSNGLIGGDDDDEREDLEEDGDRDGEEESGSSSQNAVFLLPPVRRSSRQSI